MEKDMRGSSQDLFQQYETLLEVSESIAAHHDLPELSEISPNGFPGC